MTDLERIPANAAQARAVEELELGALTGRDTCFVVALEPVGAHVPASCAACGELAAASLVEVRRKDGARIIVPYCGDCHERTAGADTRFLSVIIASCLVAVTLAGGLPVAFERLPALASLLIVGLGALAPVVIGLRFRRLDARHALSGVRAASWLEDGTLACTNEAWARKLAVDNGATLRVGALPVSRRRVWLATGPVLGLALVSLLYPFHHPRVRIVNLTPERLSIRVDGELLVDVEPTSAENASAGSERRLPAGLRRIEALDPEGRVVSRVNVELLSGKVHLFAPGSAGYCFWLETTHYGRAERSSDAILPLGSPDRFWALEVAIDSWFAPNPQPAADDRSTGGVLTALRQAPCANAPPAVRELDDASP